MAGWDAGAALRGELDLSNGDYSGSRRKALIGAFVLSFAIYLIPIFHIHAGYTPIGAMWGAFADPTPFAFAMAAGSLLLQGLAFALLYWVLRGGRGWRWLAAAGAAPLFAIAAQALFLFVIPVLVLVGYDAHPETGELRRVCTLSEATLAQVHSGTDLGLERAGEAWIILHDGYKRARLTLPGCQSTAIAAPKMGSTMDHVAAGGHLLFRADQSAHAYVGPGMEAPRRLANPPERKYWTPILSDDGGTVAWLDREPRRSGQRPHRLRLRALDTGTDETIPLPLPPRSQYDLIGADTARGIFTLARHRNEILAVDRTGKTIRGPVSPPGIENARWGFRWVGAGWVAWDGYRDKGASRVVWSLGATGTQEAVKGTLVLPRGKGVESLAVAPDGRHIAVSMETKLNLGVGKSAVVLLRTSDGKELYRRYHPLRSRVRLAFLGNDRLAMTRQDGRRGFIDVVRVPGEAGGN